MDNLVAVVEYYHTLTTQFIVDEIRKDNHHPVFGETLKNAALHYFNAGKGFRPAFVFLFAKLFAQDADEYELTQLAAAVEVLHVSSLIHDDIMDGDLTRREKESVHAKYGLNTAILAGDYLMGLAHKFAGPFAHTLGEVFSKICIGQQMDLDFENRSLPEVEFEEILTMLYYKTTILLELSCTIGASFAG
ncbi:MAG: polyprenyl synthetase family protein [Candidatus Heimdallarchaeota archaeon]|nr:polyprenyl synthetase family protein [Candidatus Heimdallarchaeota archaeon]